MNKTEVSIIMSAYNDENYIGESIKSILNQTFGNFEFLITDDCSTDRTLQILKAFAKRDSRIILFENHQNIGLTKSLNRMIAIAKGVYIARMDADDIAASDRIEKEYECLIKHHVDFVFSDCFIIDENGARICDGWRPGNLKKIINILPKFNYIPHPTVFLRRDLYLSYGLYNEEYRTGQDHELWLRFVQNNVKMYYLPQALLGYRINFDNVRNNRSPDHNYEYAKICINNCCKIKAVRYIKNISAWKHKLDIILRLLTPKLVYKKIIYFSLPRKRAI